jgi:hypothetical protein
MANLLSSLFIGSLALMGDPNGAPAERAEIAADGAARAVLEDEAVAAPEVVEAPVVEAPVVEPPAGPATPTRDAAVNVLSEVGMVYVPKTFQPGPGGTFDLVVHFHGTPGAVEKALETAGINAVLVIVNLGLGSGPYESRYQHKAALDAVVSVAARTLVKSHVMTDPHVGRIALSSWSAGYGAVWRLLMRPDVSARVDAVMLADGLHSAFMPQGYRTIDEAHIAAFQHFAELAAKGERLMTVTHSGIETYKYASTTETARYLERSVGAEVVTTSEEGARRMKKTSHAEKGSFIVDGYAGENADAHCDHLLALGTTMYPALAKRWQR